MIFQKSLYFSRSQWHVRRALQECCYINFCSVLWSPVSHSINFHSYEDSWSTTSWSFNIPDRKLRESRIHRRGFSAPELIRCAAQTQSRNKVKQLLEHMKSLPSSSFTPWSLGSSMSSASASGILPISGTRCSRPPEVLK